MKQVFYVLVLCLLCAVGCILYRIDCKLDTQQDLIDTAVETSIQCDSDLSNDVSLLSRSVSSLQSELDLIYQLIKDHKDCTALAMFTNMDRVLADQYDRTIEEQEVLYGDDERENNFFGRLYIPDVKLDVALYRGNSQSITDRKDSANIFTWENKPGEIIADHCTQDFAKLFSVEVGTLAYIRLADGSIINIECCEVIDGHNTGYDLMDNNYIDITGRSDYMMYTCRDGWYNIRVWFWSKY